MTDAPTCLTTSHSLRRRLIAITTTAAVGTALLLSVGPAIAKSDAAEGIGPGTPMPRFMLPVVNPDTFQLGRKWGPNKWIGDTANPEDKKKVMIMSFFATWCEPCKKEMPELVRLYEKYREQGLGVMLVSIDERPQREALTSFAKEKALPFPVVHDAWGVVARRYKYPGRLPYLVMASADGKVTSAHVGYAETFKDELEKMVRSRLGLLTGGASTKAPETNAHAAQTPEKTKKTKRTKKTKKSKKIKKTK